MIIKSSEMGLGPSQLYDIYGETYIHKFSTKYMVLDIEGTYNNIYHNTNSETYNTFVLFVSKSIYNLLKDDDDFNVIIDIRNPHNTLTLFIIDIEQLEDFIKEAFFNKFKLTDEFMSCLKDVYNNDLSSYSKLPERSTTFLFRKKDTYLKMKMLS